MSREYQCSGCGRIVQEHEHHSCGRMAISEQLFRDQPGGGWKRDARIAELEARVEKAERERDHATMVTDAAAEKVKELETKRAPNPGAAGTIRDKNALIEYKDAQIAKLQDRVYELEVENAALKA